MPEANEFNTETLSDEEIVTSGPGAATLDPQADTTDTGDTGDDAGDEGDDTGDTGDPSDTSDTGDTGDDAAA